jgi:hypothetical protein
VRCLGRRWCGRGAGGAAWGRGIGPGPRRGACEHGFMGSTEELLAALDERLLEGIKGKATPEGVAKLAEARAWITNPDQPHGSTIST